MTNSASGSEVAALRHWWPTFDSSGYGLELSRLWDQPKPLLAWLNKTGRSLPPEVRFLVVRVDACSPSMLAGLHASIDRLGLQTRICLAMSRSSLISLRDYALHCNNIGLMLEVNDVDLTLDALSDVRIEAIRIDTKFARYLSNTSRGAILLDMIRHFAHECGMASLGPSFERDDESGLPIKFDYVADDTVADVLAKHRLHQRAPT